MLFLRIPRVHQGSYDSRHENEKRRLSFHWLRVMRLFNRSIGVLSLPDSLWRKPCICGKKTTVDTIEGSINELSEEELVLYPGVVYAFTPTFECWPQIWKIWSYLASEFKEVQKSSRRQFTSLFCNIWKNLNRFDIIPLAFHFALFNNTALLF